MSVRVLIVEDTDHVRTMLGHVMDLHGFEVAGSAASGDEALAIAAATPFDVVVLDFKMPGMNGLETAARLRAAHPDAPMLLYSALVDDDLRERAREAGVTACVPKTDGVEALGREILALGIR